MKENRFAVTVHAQDLVVSDQILNIKELREEIYGFLFTKGFKGVSVIIDRLNSKTNFKTRLVRNNA